MLGSGACTTHQYTLKLQAILSVHPFGEIYWLVHHHHHQNGETFDLSFLTLSSVVSAQQPLPPSQLRSCLLACCHKHVTVLCSREPAVRAHNPSDSCHRLFARSLSVGYDFTLLGDQRKFEASFLLNRLFLFQRLFRTFLLKFYILQK